MSNDGGDAEPRAEIRDEASEVPYVAQLRRGFRSLRFDVALESEFRAYYWTTYRRGIRIGLWCGAALFAVFGIRDVHLLPPQVWHWTLLIRFGVMVPALLAAIPMTLRPQLPTRSALFIWLAMYFVIGGLAAAILVSQSFGHPIPYEGLILVIFFAYFLGGLRFYRALACCVTVTIAYLLLSRWQGMAGEEVGVRSYYLLVTNALGIIGGYANEHLLRRVFLTERIAEFRATHDSLTLIHNRRAGMDHLARVWRQAAREKVPLTVVMLDVDHFKAFNDANGHIAGDECLVEIARTLDQRMRRPLDMVTRFGGEEFMVIAYDTGAHGAARLCEDLRQTVQRLEIENEGTQPPQRVTISLGAASAVPRLEQPSRALIDLADRALYRAKRAGRNRYELHIAEG
jgi:diguanylate cyclase (GGDEF)-like protein